MVVNLFSQFACVFCAVFCATSLLYVLLLSLLSLSQRELLFVDSDFVACQRVQTQLRRDIKLMHLDMTDLRRTLEGVPFHILNDRHKQLWSKLNG
jgi:hypothetical protein